LGLLDFLGAGSEYLVEEEGYEGERNECDDVAGESEVTVAGSKGREAYVIDKLLKDGRCVLCLMTEESDGSDVDCVIYSETERSKAFRHLEKAFNLLDTAAPDKKYRDEVKRELHQVLKFIECD